MTAKLLLPGEVAGDYSADWLKTFDFAFLVGWIAAAFALTFITLRFEPGFFYDYQFITLGLLKLFVMLLMSLAGGMVCRHYCQVDEKGYVITNKKSWFRVNYTRKLQHFAAYLVPLINISGPGKHVTGVIPHVWEALFVLLVFLLLIKPIRERSKFFMLQFNSLDRPEDRPHTLAWIILGNILPGLVLSLFFRELYESEGFPDLALIIVFIIGIGDGLAEPVGIYLGKHKYRVPAWFSSRTYIRSIEGSACVFLTGVFFTAVFFSRFHSLQEFIAAILVVPITMTIVEATAPHSMDTPAMMIFGFSALYAVVLFF
jgi:dolichol kinase